MSARLSIVGCLLAAALAPAADPPVIVVQTAPPGRLLEDVRSVLAAAGKDELDEFEQGLKDELGDAGFAGLDMTRPLVGAVALDKDGVTVRGLFLVPVTDEKAFLELLAKADVKPAPDKAPHTYTVPPPEGVGVFPDRLRFARGYAAFGYQLTAADLSDERIAATAALHRPAETAAVAVTAHVGRVPAKAVATALTAVDTLPLLAKVAVPSAAPAAGELAKLVRRYADTLTKHADAVTLRFAFDRPAGETRLDLVVSPKPNSPLAAVAAALPATTNRFASFVGPTTAFGLRLRLPLAAPEVRAAADHLIAAGEASLKARPADEQTPVYAELLAGVRRTVATGEADLAVAVNGPDAAGKFRVLAGVSFDNPAKLEAAVRAMAAGSPAWKDTTTWDAAKAGAVGIHTIDEPNAPAEAADLFGRQAAFAFAPKALYLTLGPRPGEVLKDLITAARPPAACPLLDVSINPDRAAKLFERAGQPLADEIAKRMGVADRTVSATRLELTGGADLRLSVVSWQRYADVGEKP